MGWIDDLSSSIVCIDTAPLIYYIEVNTAYTKLVDVFFASLQQRKFLAVTSTMSLLEVLVRPTRQGDKKLAQQYQGILLKSQALRLIDVNRNIAQEAALLRANHHLKVADAIHMATAIVSEAKYFLTNDLSLPSLPNLTVLKLDELKILPEYTEQNDNQ